MQLRHGSLFSGMGGFDLAAKWMNWKNVFHCEKDPFAQKILKHHFPESISYNDIKETDFKIHTNAIDIISGGFPCQPYSLAGKRKGKADDRHLWPWMLGAIRDVKPGWVVGENVLGLVNWSGGLVFEEVQSDLETEGYQVQTFILPACSVDAPHRRDRCWIVAYNPNARTEGMRQERSDAIHGFRPTADTRSSGRIQQRGGESIRDTDRNNTNEEPGRVEFQDGFGGSLEREILSNTKNIRRESTGGTWQWRSGSEDSHLAREYWERWPTQSPLCNGNDGVPARLDASAVFNKPCKPTHARTFSKWRNESIRCGGNAVVPQVPYQIFKAIQEYENLVNQSQQ